MQLDYGIVITVDYMTSNLIFNIEREVALLLVDKLKHFDISLERASLIAKFILMHLPENTPDANVLKILPTFDDEFTELASIVHKHLIDYEQKHQQLTVESLTDLIKEQQLDQAKTLVTKYFDKKLS